MERIESAVVRSTGAPARRRFAARALAALGGAVICSLPWAAAAQTAPICGADVKAEVAKALSAAEASSDDDKLALEKQLYAK